jgi:hypothetical protein
MSERWTTRPTIAARIADLDAWVADPTNPDDEWAGVSKEVWRAARATVPAEDAVYLAQAATHMLDHLATERPTFYCEDKDNVRHFAAEILASKDHR